MEYTRLATDKSIQNVAAGLAERGFIPYAFDTGKEALEKVIASIPHGSSVMNGASRTLQDIGYIEYLKSGKHQWKNLHEGILAEKDPVKQGLLRRQAILSDYYLGSVHAITETGEMMISSNSGSQLSHLVYTSPNVILIVSTQKIVQTLTDAFKRIDEHVVALENERMLGLYNVGTMKSKTVILHRENPMMGRKVEVVLVKEKLGF